MKDKLAGKFIVLDGPDGCGKSTQVEMLAEWVRGCGVEVAGWRDPGGTVIGEKIRDILLDKAHEGMADNVEVLLYMAARAQLWKEHIKVALADGKCVILDRWVSSSCAYQGVAGGFGIDNVVQLGKDCLEMVWPDLTVVLDVDMETAKGRLDAELDRMELKGDEYHGKVRDGFLQLAKKYDNIVVVDATDEINAVHAKVLEAVRWL